MKTLRESILSTPDLDKIANIERIMNIIRHKYLSGESFDYDITPDNILKMTTYTGGIRFDNIFMEFMHELGVKKIIWDPKRMTHTLYGDWDIDTKISGNINIRCKSIACRIDCNYMEVNSPLTLNNSKIYCDSIRFKYGCKITFKGNSKIYVPKVNIYGDYAVDKNLLRDNLFINELETEKLIKIGAWKNIIPNFDTEKEATMAKIAGKNFPNIKDIDMYYVAGSNIYIGKDQKKISYIYEISHKVNEYKLKDGNIIVIGQTR